MEVFKMKKLLVVGLIVLSATSFAAPGGGIDSMGGSSSMEKHTKEVKEHHTKEAKEVKEHHTKEAKKEVSKHHEEKEKLQKKAHNKVEDGKELQTQTQQRIRLEEKDREDILKPENAKSKKFRKKMEKKYKAKWKLLEEIAHEVR
jgi:hypothetical protein